MTRDEAINIAENILDYVDSYCNLDGVDDYRGLIETIAEMIGYEREPNTNNSSPAS